MSDSEERQVTWRKEAEKALYTGDNILGRVTRMWDVGTIGSAVVWMVGDGELGLLTVVWWN